jgi:hypothetical protein
MSLAFLYFIESMRVALEAKKAPKRITTTTFKKDVFESNIVSYPLEAR